MAADPRITNAVASAACDAVVGSIDTGGAGTLRIYDGTIPTNADTAVGAQNILSEHTMSATAFGAASDGVATAAAIGSDTSANTTGTAAWFRITSGAGTTIMDGTVGTAAADLIVNTVSFVSGANVDIDSFTVTMPKT
jgi:hypothetical protein